MQGFVLRRRTSGYGVKAANNRLLVSVLAMAAPKARIVKPPKRALLEKVSIGDIAVLNNWQRSALNTIERRISFLEEEIQYHERAIFIFSGDDGFEKYYKEGHSSDIERRRKEKMLLKEALGRISDIR
mgnify:CR=1 FL=1